MTTTRKPFHTMLLSTLFALAGLAALSGCASLGMGGSDQGASKDPYTSSSSMENPPYRASDFSDLLIPSELNWDREKSMIVRTDSFAGGVLAYHGRVEISSLSDFFVNNLPKNGWKLVGSAKYQNILLAFVKQNKTCTIILSEDKLLMRTLVSIYVAEDTSAGRSGAPAATSPSNPFGL